MGKFALIAASLAFFLMFSGCTQSSLLQACQGIPSEKLPNCVYVNAVLSQDPFPCYSLSDVSQRTTCIKDATDPAMKSELERSSQAQRDLIFAPKEPTPVQGIARQPPSQNPVQQQPDAETGCMAKEGGERDVCFSTFAIENRIIAHCAQIINQPLRESCIAQVARATRDIASCETLPVQEDYEICRAYSQGGAQ